MTGNGVAVEYSVILKTNVNDFGRSGQNKIDTSHGGAKLLIEEIFSEILYRWLSAQQCESKSIYTGEYWLIFDDYKLLISCVRLIYFDYCSLAV